MSLSGTGLTGEQSPLRRALIVTSYRDQPIIELEKFLLENGFQYDLCYDGNSALSLVQRLNPSLIISDVLISGIDGISLCTLIKRDPQTAGTAVVLRSVLDAGDRFAELGAVAFVKSPAGPEDLIDSVRALIESDARVEPAMAC